MAPEFFPLIGSFAAFVALAASVLLTVIVGVGLLVWAHYDSGRRKTLRVVSAIAFCSALPLALGVFLVGSHIRQRYFLNEPLVSACASGDLAQAQRLLDRGASPDAYDCDGTATALMAAASSGHRDIVGLLLRRGANARLRDDRGRTAFDQAKAAGHDEIATMIEQSRGQD